VKLFDSDLIHAIENADSILVTSHLNPDGDAAGSVTGLADSLRLAGKRVTIAWAGSVGGRFEFLFKNETVLAPDDLKPDYDLVIILDIGSEERTGFAETIRGLGCPLVNIDHHGTNEGFADFDHVDTRASSTCEVVYHLIKTAGWPVNKTIAESLYTGLVTDSRHFQNEGVTTDTFLTAAELKGYDIDAGAIIRKLVQNRSELDLRVLGLALSVFEMRCNERIALAVLRHKDITALGATYRHAWSGGVFGYLISLESALVSVTFIESDTGKIFCELRSKMGFDVSKIASMFNGGGHPGASGCSGDGPLDTFVSDVVGEIEKQIGAF
jgi:bifunctional oligoribonuclease and PAP phosphatase NrnA